jgi:uncharacterized membrane-anchored protein YhcB (DUF1043 family)
MFWAIISIGALVVGTLVFVIYKVSGESSDHRNTLERAHDSELESIREKNEDLTKTNEDLQERLKTLEKALRELRRRYETTLNKLLLKLGPDGIDDSIRSSLRRLSENGNKDS